MDDRQLIDPTALSDVADWSRERPRRFWDPSRKLLLAIRQFQRWQTRRGILAKLFRKVTIVRYRFWTVITGADIPLNSMIGGGLLIPHPNGIVIHPGADIGPNCLILQQVTIGTRGKPEFPVIEAGVVIGAGAKILGPVHIGANARIGANAVVLSDIPEGGVAVGIPARVVVKGSGDSSWIEGY